VFLKVDGDENRDWILELGVTSYPTFFFLLNEKKVDSFSGADEKRLRSIISDYADREEVKPCPYQHFPIKDAEQVKYADMKWDAVESKLNEYNSKVDPLSQQLSLLELADLDVIIQKLQTKANYHSSTFTEAQYNIIDKLLHWPLEYLGPPLNLFRVFVLHPHAAQTYSAQITGDKRKAEDVVTVLVNIMTRTDKSITAMLTIRVLCNFFSRRVLSIAVASRCEEVLDSVHQVVKRLEDENLRASGLALYINHTLLFNEDSKFYEAGKIQLLSSLPEHFSLPRLSPKLLYRLLVILGSLMYADSNTTELAVALEMSSSVQEVIVGVQDIAVQQVAAEVLKVLDAK